MLKKLPLIIFILFSVQAYGQKKIKNFIENNTNIVSTVDPDALDFQDLEVIGKSIGNSRIVMLGEQDHGDAPTFLAKTRLIKYLHEQKGFNVLAFESDFFALNEGWGVLPKDDKQIDTFLRKNIFSIWTNCKQCENLFYNYIPNRFTENKPLIVSGFDSQPHGKYSENLKKYLDDYLTSNSFLFTKTKSYQTHFLPFIDSARTSKNLVKHETFVSQIDTIFSQFPEELRSNFQWLVLQNLRENSKSGISFLKKGEDYLEIRDKQMAENLTWLVNKKFPNEKIIVWAHSEHVLKNKNLIKTVFNNENWKNMGHFFTRDSLLNAQTYILGFSSKTGTAGRITNPKTYNISSRKNNSFESWINDSAKYAFIDFKKFRELNPKSIEYFDMKGKHHSYNEAVWTNVFDGVFYIRDMYPCERIN